MNTHYLQQLSFHKLEIHQPTASLHSFVLVRNSLLQSIRTQQEQDSWLDACFDELDPESSPTDSTLIGDQDSSLAMGLCYDTEQQQQDDNDVMDDIDMLLLEEDDDDDDISDDDDDDDGPVSPEQSTLLQQPHYRSRPFGSPAFFIPMDDDDDDGDDDEDEDGVENMDNFIPADATTLPLAATTATSHYNYHTNNNDSSSSTKQVLGTKKGKSAESGGGDSISDYWTSQQHGLPSLPPSL